MAGPTEVFPISIGDFNFVTPNGRICKLDRPDVSLQTHQSARNSHNATQWMNGYRQWVELGQDNPIHYDRVSKTLRPQSRFFYVALVWTLMHSLPETKVIQSHFYSKPSRITLLDFLSWGSFFNPH